MNDKSDFLKRRNQLRGLGFDKDEIIKILSIFPGIGGKIIKGVKKEAKGGMVKKSTRK